MQIFSPYPNFTQIAKCLDNKRLNKQKVELYQIINTIVKNGGWRNHPAVKMAVGYELFFIEYGLEIAQECLNRGFQDTMIPRISALRFNFSKSKYQKPWYWGNKDFHLSHQSNLLRKMPEHYDKFFLDIPDNLPYWWPTSNLEKV